MVDFQSRDTRRRGGGDSEADEEEEPDGAETTETEETDTSPEAASQSGTEQADGQSQADTGEMAADEPTTEAVSSPADERERTTAPGDTAPDDTVPTAGRQADRGSETETRSIDIALVAVGDAATSEGDPNPMTDRLTDSLTTAGHSVTVTRELAGGYDEIQGAVDGLVSRPDVDAVVTVGGTGVTQSDVVIEAVHPLFEKVLPGFGEVVRNLLFYQAGTSVVGVRTTAGVTGESPIFCLPGERKLAIRAVEAVVATEAPALVAELE